MKIEKINQKPKRKANTKALNPLVSQTTLPTYSSDVNKLEQECQGYSSNLLDLLPQSA